MKKSILLSVAAAIFISAAGFGQGSNKLVSTKTNIKCLYQWFNIGTVFFSSGGCLDDVLIIYGT